MAAMLMLGAVVALASGCKEEDPPAISVDQPLILIGTELQMVDLRVMSNTDWTAETSADWLTLSKDKGRGTYNIKIAVTKYDGANKDGRQATIIFKTSGGAYADMATVTINQGTCNATLQVRPPSYEIDARGGKVTMLVHSNTDWTLGGVVEAADGGWAIPNVTSGTGDVAVVFTVSKNETGRDRVMEFYVTTKPGADQMSLPFTLTQLAVENPTLELTQTDLYFDAIVTAANESIFVPFITSVTTNPLVTATETWCTPTVIEKNGVKGVLVKVTSNDGSIKARTCIVNVTAVVDGKSVSKQMNVTQAGSDSPDITIIRPTITIPAKGTGTNNQVEFNIGYYTHGTTSVSLVQDLDSWIVSATLNTTTKTVKVIAEENHGDLRTTTITLIATGAGQTIAKPVNIIQLAPPQMSFTLSTYSLHLPVGGGDIEFYAIGNVPSIGVVATGLQTWITDVKVDDATLTGYAGTVKKITAKVTSNAAQAASRDGSIEVIGAYGMQNPIPLNVAINQDGAGAPDAELARNNITIPAKAGGPYKVGITGVGSLTPTVIADVDWINSASTAPAYVAADNAIVFYAKDNTLTEDRPGLITVTLVSGGVAQHLSINVTQLGLGSPELDIYQEEWNVSSAEQKFDVPIISVGSTTWKLLGYSPQAMFKTAPVDTDQTKFEVDLKANTTTKTNKATIVLVATSGDKSVFYTVVVNQEGVEAPNLKPLANEVHLGAAATVATEEFKIPFLGYSSDITFLSLFYSGKDGASMFNTTDTKIGYEGTSPDYTGAYLQISVKENTTLNEKSGIIRVTAMRGGEPQTFDVTVYQAAAGSPLLIFPNSTFSYGPAGEDDTRVYFENPNGATVIIKDAPAWITDRQPTVAGVYDNVQFDVTANATSKALNGRILIEAAIGTNKALYSVNVSQAGLAPIGASLAAANLDVQWKAGTAADKLVVNGVPSGATVTMSSTATWLASDPAVIVGDQATIVVGALSDNPKTTPRNAYVNIVVTRGTESQTLTATITQEGAPGPKVMLAYDKLIIPANSAANDTFDLSFFNTASNVVYTVTSSDPTFVTGTVTNHVLTVTNVAGPNATTAIIPAELKIEAVAAGVTSVIILKVEQLGVNAPNLVLSTNSLLFGPKGQTEVMVYFENDNNATVTATVPTTVPAWITNASVNSGNQGYVKFDVEPNNTSSDLSGQIILTAVANGLTVYYPIQIVQNGLSPMSISATPASVLTDSGLKTISDIVRVLDVPTGADISLSTTQDWIQVPAGNLASPYTFQIGIWENTTGAPRSATVIVTATRGLETKSVTVSVQQSAKEYAQPKANTDLKNLLFAADQSTPETKTITIQNTSDDYVTNVRVPDGFTASAVAKAGATATFTVTPNGNNNSVTPLEGEIEIIIMNGDKEQTLTVPVIQKALLAPIQPLVYTVIFPANVSGASAAQLVELVGYDSSLYSLTASVSGGGWFTMDNSANPVKFYPNDVYTGKSPRKAEISYIVKSTADPKYLSTFKITVIQEGALAPNVSYAPATQIFPSEGGVAKTLFANPEGVTLQMVSPTSTGFVSDATFTVANEEIQFTVQPNLAATDRSVIMNVVAKDAIGNIIGEYPITIYQIGIGTKAIKFVAQFNDTSTFIMASPTVPGPSPAIPTTVGMTLDPGVTITSAAPAVGAPAWLTNVTYSNAPAGVSFDVDPDAVDWPAAGATSSATIAVQVTESGVNYMLYYPVSVFNPVLPTIDATIAPSQGIIKAIDTDISTIAPVITNLNAGVIGTIECECIGASWLDVAAFSVVGNVLTITGIPANTTIFDRSSIVKIPLTKLGYQDQLLTFVLTQKGIPTINAVWDPSYVADALADDYLFSPIADDGATVKAGSVKVDGGTTPAWVTAFTGVGADVEFTLALNNTGAPRWANVELVMEKTNHQNQTCSFTLFQLPETTQTLLSSAGPVAGNLTWEPGSTTTIPFQIAVPGTVVSVWSHLDPLFSAVSVTAQGSQPATPGSVQVTAAARNASGATKTGAVLLVATNGATVEYYKVNVNQVSLTPAQLTDMYTFGVTGYLSNIQRTPGSTAITASLTGGQLVGWQTNYINVSTTNANINDYTGLFVEVNDTPDNFRNPSESGAPSWDAGNHRMTLGVRAGVSQNNGTSNFTFTVTVDNVMVAYNIAITK